MHKHCNIQILVGTILDNYSSAGDIPTIPTINYGQVPSSWLNENK